MTAWRQKLCSVRQGDAAFQTARLVSAPKAKSNSGCINSFNSARGRATTSPWEDEKTGLCCHVNPAPPVCPTFHVAYVYTALQKKLNVGIVNDDLNRAIFEHGIKSW